MTNEQKAGELKGGTGEPRPTKIPHPLEREQTDVQRFVTRLSAGRKGVLPTEGYGPPSPNPLIRIRIKDSDPEEDWLPLYPGLYGLVAGRAGGKTYLASRFARFLAGMPGIGPSNVFYKYVWEPRAETEDLGLMPSPGWLRKMLDATKGRTFVIIDSLSFALAPLGRAILGRGDDPTFKEGVRLSSILGAAIVDRAFAERKQFVLATFNTDVFPRASILEAVTEGACEPASEIGTLKIRERDKRRWRSLPLGGVDADANRGSSVLGTTKKRSRLTVD